MIFTLPNGMRVALRQHAGNVSYAGVLINAGTRDEPAAAHGLAHFVEHTIFKGTPTRSAWNISNRMESIGGELNAYTSKETTSVYTVAPAGYEGRAAELIADLIENASFPAAELDKEREVIVEEINSCLDNPADYVFDRFEELLYRGSRLENSILGTPESVRSITGADCRAFISRFYNPANMVGFLSTPLPEAKALRLLERYWGRILRDGARPLREAPEPIGRFEETKDDDGHQAHTIVGTRLFARTDPRRFPLMLLNNYLGGPSMNSRLNYQLRDRRGLVYTVESVMSLLSDTGALYIYFGTDRRSVDKCLRIIYRELDALAQNTLSPRRLDKIKAQYCGQLLVSSDNAESMAMAQGKNLMFYGSETDIPALAARLREVSAEEIRGVAELLVPSAMSHLTLM
ncbi:MAG: insulinase family protein [Muribaculaceae bacterium]|nr:insulinase family protein [Muribaculaceae bacterium]